VLAAATQEAAKNFGGRKNRKTRDFELILQVFMLHG